MDLYEALLNGWIMRALHLPNFPGLPNRLVICIPSYTTLQHPCMVCNEPHFYCFKCNCK